MKNIAIVDAGPLIALFDKSDKYHQEVKARLETYRSEEHGRLITTWPIISETAYMLSDRVHLQAETDFFTWIIEGGVDIFDFDKDHLPQVIELQNKYSNIPMDFSDATLVIVAKELRVNRVFTINGDFLIYRTVDKKYFKSLL